MKILLAAALLAVAAPALAQMPPPSNAMTDGPRGRGGHRAMFASMSDAGRATMIAAMRAADPRTDRAATMAARDRMLAVLDADRLDAAALRRAMDDERTTAMTAKARHQAAMLTGFQQLSLADRRAFVADARAMRERMQARMAEWRGRRGDRDMPPPR